jgi:hypothetical protein
VKPPKPILSFVSQLSLGTLRRQKVPIQGEQFNLSSVGFDDLIFFQGETPGPNHPYSISASQNIAWRFRRY